MANVNLFRIPSHTYVVDLHSVVYQPGWQMGRDGSDTVCLTCTRTSREQHAGELF